MKWKLRISIWAVCFTLGALLAGYGTLRYGDWRAHRAAVQLGLLEAEKVETLRDLLDVKDGELKKTLDKISKLDADLALAHSTNVEFKRLVPEGAQSFREACADWSDEHGRFHFSQAERTLKIDQVFSVATFVTKVRSGKVYTKVVVHELSPKTGDRLGVVQTKDSVTTYFIPPAGIPKWTAFVGGAWDNSGANPLVAITYRPLANYRVINGLTFGAASTFADGYLFGGWSWSF